MHTAVIVTEDGREAEVGETGELWCKGPNITPGYWNWPEATEESFEDGWLKTGDAARRDEDGFYYIVDRKDHLRRRERLPSRSGKRHLPIP